MIEFNNWQIWADPRFGLQQNDHLSRELIVSGPLPEGWEWTILVQVDGQMDIWPLQPRQAGGFSILLTAQQLGPGGFYRLQLRGTQGEVTRHTNVITLFVPRSLCGDKQWPTLPTEFSEAEQRILTARDEAAALNAHPPIVGSNGNWFTWVGNEYVDSGFPSQGEKGEPALYYTTLSSAIKDINAGTEEHTTNKSDGKVAVLFSDNGRPSVKLLDDVSEDDCIVVNKDIDLILNGKTLTLHTSNNISMDFANGTTCTIDGRIAGSKVDLPDFNTTASSAVFKSGGSLFLNGGTYTLRSRSSVSSIKLVTAVQNASQHLEMDGCQIDMQAFGDNSVIRFVQWQGVESIIKNCTIRATAVGDCYGLVASGSVLVENSTFVIVGGGVATCLWPQSYTGVTVLDSNIQVSGSGTVRGIYVASTGVANKGVQVENCDIQADAPQGVAYGIYSPENSKVTMHSTKIFADAPGCSVNVDTAYAIGVALYGTGRFTDCEITGTHSGLQAGATSALYVEGGVYDSYDHGGIYFSGKDGSVAYVNNATMRGGYYSGKYDLPATHPDHALGGFYVGNTNTSEGTTTVYMDGCIIDTSDTCDATAVLKTTNSVLYISNTTRLSTRCRFRIDPVLASGEDAGNRMYIGIGMGLDITEANFDHPEYVIETAELYRKKHPDAQLNGNDFSALLNCLKTKLQH